MKNVQATIDKTAIGLSFICTVHCLLLPAALVLLPALTTSSFNDEAFHQLLLIAVLPTSLIALTMGCRKHGNWTAIVIGFLGLTILTLTAFFGHDLLGEAGEKTATILGASIIAFGHLRNHRLCKKLPCHC